jgi:glycosyltransferase involved in cell wall biosynthesis
MVAPQDPEALAQALASFLESPAKRQLVGATAKAHVARYYDANTWVQQLLALYRGLYTPAPPILSQEHV